MAWELTYSAPKGVRMNRGFWAVTLQGSGFWYCEDINKWGETDSFPKGSSYSTHYHGPKTTKAFLRYLNKHPELRGVEVVFVHNCYYDSVEGKIPLHITGKWVESREV